MRWTHWTNLVKPHRLRPAAFWRKDEERWGKMVSKVIQLSKVVQLSTQHSLWGGTSRANSGLGRDHHDGAKEGFIMIYCPARCSNKRNHFLVWRPWAGCPVPLQFPNEPLQLLAQASPPLSKMAPLRKLHDEEVCLTWLLSSSSRLRQCPAHAI